MHEIDERDKIGAIYLDCNGSTPTDERVVETMRPYLTANPANPASQLHLYGQQAHRKVEEARDQVAALVDARPQEVIFTSGATESNNLALLGIAQEALEAGRTHIVSSAIEHPAVLEPLAHLSDHGFEVELVAPGPDGVVRAEELLARVRPDTAMVSLMHVNNVVGTVQPIGEVADGLADHRALMHVDAAQGAAHRFEELGHPRLDLISISAHKMYGPKGIGALIYRRRPQAALKIAARSFGGGHEGGLRPGTVATPLVAGFGRASKLCREESDHRKERNRAFRRKLIEGLAPLHPTYHGEPEEQVSHVVCLSFSGVRARAVLLRLRDLVAASNGAACRATDNHPSHVLVAMGLSDGPLEEAIRLSWYHDTPAVDWSEVVERLISMSR
ncbi:MAG: cysteine desulfurase family protein [Persicimonas sp.]